MAVEQGQTLLPGRRSHCHIMTKMGRKSSWYDTNTAANGRRVIYSYITRGQKCTGRMATRPGHALPIGIIAELPTRTKREKILASQEQTKWYRMKPRGISIGAAAMLSPMFLTSYDHAAIRTPRQAPGPPSGKITRPFK